MPNKLQRFYTSTGSLTGDNTNPFTYFEWLEHQSASSGIDRSDAFGQYNVYLQEWFDAKKIKGDEQNSVYVKALYIDLLKQITLDYTTPEEKKFLTNIDFNNAEDLDIAVPFFAKKLKEIAIYFTKKREEVKFSKVTASIRGSKAGTEQTIYRNIVDIIQTDADIQTQLKTLNIAQEDVLTHLKIDIDELFDTEQKYFDIPIESLADNYADSNTSRSTYFTTNTIPSSGNLFIDTLFQDTVADIISQVPVLLTSEDETLQDISNISLSVTDSISGTELERLHSSNFVNYISAEENLNLYNIRDMQQKYIGTNFYYLSTGATTSDIVSGELYKASRPHGDLLNRFNSSVATVQGENLYKVEFIGGFFKSDKVGILNYTSLNNNFEFTGLSANSMYYFPDPEVGARGYGNSSIAFASPVTYTENTHWLKKDISNQYSCGEPKLHKNMLSFYPYQSKHEHTDYTPIGVSRHTDSFNFWEQNAENIWTNADIYPISGDGSLLGAGPDGRPLAVLPITTRQDKLLIDSKNVHKWRTDIYGNNYALVKTGIKPEMTTVNTAVTALTETQYTTTDTTPRSSITNNVTDSNHSKKLLHEAELVYGTLYFRNLNSDTIGTMEDVLSGVYTKYDLVDETATATFAGRSYNLKAIKDELLEKLIDFDIIYDILILKTDNYIVIEKLEYDYTTNTIKAISNRRIFIPRVITGNKYEKFGNWWFDEKGNRILFSRTTVHPDLSGTPQRMIYPDIYKYDINKLAFKQVYPNVELTDSELRAETGRYSLSGVPSRYNIQEIGTPVMTYNKESERFILSYVSSDNTKNLFYTANKFRLLDEAIEFIDIDFYKNNYTIFEESFADAYPVTEYFTQTNTDIDTIFEHVPANGVLHLGSKDVSGEIIPYEDSAAAWTYGKINENFIAERDIVITFEFAMYSTSAPEKVAVDGTSVSTPTGAGEGISVIFFDALKDDSLTLYGSDTASASKIAGNNNVYEGGGTGTAFGYLSGTPSLSGLDSGHACVALDIRGEFADTIPNPNAITVRGPIDTGGTALQVITQDLPIDVNLHQTEDTFTNLEFTKCRVTLTDLGRRIIVETTSSTSTDFIEHVNERMEDFWPADYNLPSRLKPAVAFCTSTDYATNCVLRNIEITGDSNIIIGDLPTYTADGYTNV
jgi:hypothetical protein